MANPDFPRGFQPIRMISGCTELTSQIGDISSSNGEIDKHDLLERRTDGYIHRAQASSVTIIGVANEHKAANSGGTINYTPTDNLVMLAQASAAEIDAQTDFDLVYDIVVTSPTGTGRSQMEINSASGAATSTLPIKILRVAPMQPQSKNVLGANVLLECMVNTGVTKGAGLIG